MSSRLLLLAAIFAIGCKRSTPDAAGPALRFLPKTAETALRLDITRARTWSGWQKASAAAFRGIAAPLAAVKKACDLDPIADASSVVFARGDGDITFVIAGLPKDKVAACPAKLGSPIPDLTFVPDGERFGIMVEGKSFASGAILPTGELVLVSRKGQGIEPAAWRTEVASGTGAAPAWWAELDQTQPFAVRIETKERTVTGSAELADPLVIRGKVVSPTAELAATDQARAKAIVDFLAKAEAGTGRLEPKGTTLYADFTAKGPEIDKLLAAGLSTLGADQHTPEAPTGLDTSPIACTELAGAVATYMKTSLGAMPAEQQAQMQAMIEKLLPVLQKAYVDSCTTGAWPPAAIHCHVDSASNVPRFEKCRLVLSEDQRTKFDGLVQSALTGG
jgi:hypothetical protein